ncbi:MAG: hypothetical protein AABX11_01575 [Nanoarchaeota archaeon]
MFKKGNSTGWIIVGVIIVLIIFGAVYVFSNSEAKKTVCGTHIETYTESTKGCDQISNCQCLHNSWGGLGACDSCQCTREVSNC